MSPSSTHTPLNNQPPSSPSPHTHPAAQVLFLRILHPCHANFRCSLARANRCNGCRHVLELCWYPETKRVHGRKSISSSAKSWSRVGGDSDCEMRRGDRETLLVADRNGPAEVRRHERHLIIYCSMQNGRGGEN